MATEFYSGGEQDVLTVTTADGYRITGTPNHPVRRESGEWARLDALEIGDRLMLAPVKLPTEALDVPFNLWAVRRHDRDEPAVHAPSLPRVQVDENVGAVLGYILGDGCILKNSIRISCDPQDEDVIADIQARVAALGLASSSKHKLRTSPLTHRGVVDVSINSARFNDFLAHLGLVKDKRKFLSVPWAILQSPRPVVRAFLRALFETDGTVTGGGGKTGASVSLTSKEEEFARGVLLLLTAFGIRAKLHRSWNRQYQRDYYRVYLGRDAADAFAREVGFVGARKSAALAKVTARPHSNAFRPMVWSDEVVSIERGRAPVFDLTVPGPHEFAGNGLMCHNTPIKAYESAAAGAAVVATPWLYGAVIDNGRTGLLAETADEWERALLALVDDEETRRGLAAALYNEVEARWSMERNWWRWPAAWALLAQAARERSRRHVA